MQSKKWSILPSKKEKKKKKKRKEMEHINGVPLMTLFYIDSIIVSIKRKLHNEAFANLFWKWIKSINKLISIIGKQNGQR